MPIEVAMKCHVETDARVICIAFGMFSALRERTACKFHLLITKRAV